jgi:hypothetical protein
MLSFAETYENFFYQIRALYLQFIFYKKTRDFLNFMLRNSCSKFIQIYYNKSTIRK